MIILIKIKEVSFKKNMNISSAQLRLFLLGPRVLNLQLRLEPGPRLNIRKDIFS